MEIKTKYQKLESKPTKIVAPDILRTSPTVPSIIIINSGRHANNAKKECL